MSLWQRWHDYITNDPNARKPAVFKADDVVLQAYAIAEPRPEWPGYYVVERWVILRTQPARPVRTHDEWLARTLDEARQLIPPGDAPVEDLFLSAGYVEVYLR